MTMIILHIEHPVRTFDTWRMAFESDPVGRRRGGVRRYAIYRPVDDPNYVALDLEFDDRVSAEAFHANLERLWQSPQAAPALAGTPRVRILELVDQAAVEART
jgi:quinol monooxygenase YgiN